MASNPGLWFHEPVRGFQDLAYRCDRVVYSGRTRYQQVDIVDTLLHGRMLFLDQVCQSAQWDEFIYHEVLVHPALYSQRQPKSVLVIGGAEGATLREIFRHPGIERVVMVDIDGELVDLCRTHLPTWHEGSYQDPRLELIIGDGRQFVAESTELFDVIVVDLSDPLDGGPAVFLFTREFYRLLDARLVAGGTMAVQGEGVSPQDVSLHARMVNTLRSVFPVVRPMPYFMYSFHRPDCHILASRDPAWSQADLAHRMQQVPLPLRYISPELAQGLFALPPYLHEAYAQYQEVLSDAGFSK